MKKTTISIVVPIYNENESLEELFDTLKTALPHQTVEYIAVDDGSTDGTIDTLQTLKKTFSSPITIIKFRKNRGKSAALAAGFQQANGEYIVTLDADLQDDPLEIPKLLEMADSGYDLVLGWRKDRHDPRIKIHLSYFFNKIVAHLSGLPLHDTNSGLKVFRKQAAKELVLYGELHRFIPYLMAQKGFRITEVPVVHHARKHGHSKFSTGRFRAAFDLITTVFLSSFKDRPLHIFGPIGVSMFSLGGILLVYLSILHFQGQSIGRRPLLFLGILFVLFGVQMFSTGLLGELITNNRSHKDKNTTTAEIL